MICKTGNFPKDTNKYCSENRTDYPHHHGEECEYWGFNEMGGLKPLDSDGNVLEWIEDETEGRFRSITFVLNGKVDCWEDHCQRLEVED